MIPSAKRRAVFLDRDGTINEEKDYLHRIEDFVFIPGAAEAIRRLKEAGFLVIVVTNQSGVARGYYTLEEVAILHRHMQRVLETVGAAVDGIYVCPHHPVEGVGEYRRECDCRKGRPGMLLRAAREHGIDLSRSYMIGDKIADVEAGEVAGCLPLMVLTGYGKTESAKISSDRVRRFADLVDAADFILARNPAQK
nr:D-glycero-beta-D-manno-heptose 1,7-bisphosphate 7-phosphatase [Desulfuromonas sp. TF]